MPWQPSGEQMAGQGDNLAGLQGPDRELFGRVNNGSAAEVKDCLMRGANVDALEAQGDTPLTQAARRGDRSIVDVLLSNGASVNHRNKKGSTPLIAAATKGHTELVQLFISLGANVNEETESKDTALSLAVWQNHTAVCVALMDAGADAQHVDQFGDTMLLDAAKHGNAVVMRKLIEGKVPVDHANKEGETALLRAAWKGERAALELLLDKGASMKHANRNGYNALIMAAAHNNVDCVRVLVERKAPLDAADRSGTTALVHLSKHWDEKNYQAMQWLVEAGCRLDQNKTGELMLCTACEFSQIPLIQALVARKVNVNFANPSKSGAAALALHIGGLRPDVSVVQLLLANKADPDAADNSGNTALRAAVLKGLPDICSVLLAKGASIFHENKSGETVLAVALKAGDKNKAVPVILAAAGTLDPATLLLNAAQTGNIEKLKEALSAKSKPKPAAGAGAGAAAAAADTKADAKADTKADTKAAGDAKKAGAGAGAGAEEDDDDDASGVNVNFANKSGQTALMLAARHGSVECVRALLDAGARVSQTDKEGLTALIHAIRKGNAQAAELLARVTAAGAKGQAAAAAVADPKSAAAAGSGAASEYRNNTRFLMRLGTRLLGGLDLSSDLAAAHAHIQTLEAQVNALRKAAGQQPLDTSFAATYAAEKAKRRAADAGAPGAATGK